jgi:hypothetical protein
MLRLETFKTSQTTDLSVSTSPTERTPNTLTKPSKTEHILSTLTNHSKHHGPISVDITDRNQHVSSGEEEDDELRETAG